MQSTSVCGAKPGETGTRKLNRVQFGVHVIRWLCDEGVSRPFPGMGGHDIVKPLRFATVTTGRKEPWHIDIGTAGPFADLRAAQRDPQQRRAPTSRACFPTPCRLPVNTCASAMPTFLTALALFSCLSGGAIASRVAAPPPPILPALPWPQGLQGHDDENWPVKLASANGSSTPQLEARYAALSQLRPGIRRYNMFWNTFETEPGQDHPFACAPGSVLIPPSQAARKAAGFHGFHCYSEKQLHTFGKLASQRRGPGGGHPACRTGRKDPYCPFACSGRILSPQDSTGAAVVRYWAVWHCRSPTARAPDTILSLDRQAGAQTGAIIYSAPAFYRHPNCSGFIFGKDVIKGGCAPVDSAMDAYEDYVLMLMHRYGPLGLSHYVIWNEVASAGWMDMSPFIPNRAGPNGSFPLTEKQFDVWVTKYASLVQRAASARATAGQVDKAMLWTSNDRLWERPHQREGAPLHTGVKPFLDRLWPKLAAANVTFGTAVHPYDPGRTTARRAFLRLFPPLRFTRRRALM